MTVNDNNIGFLTVLVRLKFRSRVGHDAGPVRPPLTDLEPDEMEMLKALIDKLGPQ